MPAALMPRARDFGFSTFSTGLLIPEVSRRAAVSVLAASIRTRDPAADLARAQSSSCHSLLPPTWTEEVNQWGWSRAVGFLLNLETRLGRPHVYTEACGSESDSMPRLLSREELTRELKKLDGWTARGRFITKQFEFENFMDGIRFVNGVAAAAENLEHHPDIAIRYTDVRLSLQTHSEGGVTKWDLQLARAIDRLRR